MNVAECRAATRSCIAVIRNLNLNPLVRTHTRSKMSNPSLAKPQRITFMYVIMYVWMQVCMYVCMYVAYVRMYVCPSVQIDGYID